MKDFDSHIRDHMIDWRKRNAKSLSPHWGTQNGHTREWIMPHSEWESGLWRGIRGGSENSLPDYLEKYAIQRHTGSHNLKSSWTLCANLYFTFQESSTSRMLLAEFLRKHVNSKVENVIRIELEYEEKDKSLKPSALLGESSDGKRGSGQTSPDLGILVELTGGGTGLLLVENKYVEHSFYRCSGRGKDSENPDDQRCFNADLVLKDTMRQCWQCNWKEHKARNREYWHHLLNILDRRGVRTLTKCPAAVAGYQLFRQQALAEALAKGSRYECVMSCVAWDDRNDNLRHCLNSTGIDDFSKSWETLFKGKAVFRTWSHQQWVQWVSDHDQNKYWSSWLRYVTDRYDLHNGEE